MIVYVECFAQNGNSFTRFCIFNVRVHRDKFTAILSHYSVLHSPLYSLQSTLSHGTKVKQHMKKQISEALKKFAFRYTSLGKPSYPYNIEPMQLTLLVNEIERLKSTQGCLVEIGVARGMTTRFLAEHICNEGLQDTHSYYAIDTFTSFVEADLEYEVKERGKKLSELKGFAYNDFDIWQNNFKEFPFIKPIQSDCVEFDYQSLAPIKMTFLDVDLYLPIIKTLPKLYDATVSGGVIIVDDVKDKQVYDGAYQAYHEFCKDHKIKPIIVGNQCGVIYKP